MKPEVREQLEHLSASGDRVRIGWIDLEGKTDRTHPMSPMQALTMGEALERLGASITMVERYETSESEDPA